nr:MAG TPA: hypothetical protein [Caudoviricetes sp.]DAR97849.1 MAG TPA: hypothetical protein [Caudoviricetes sp.]DAS45794.1 MAG TPA: hypothetical protein [Caudoviricetes sp.]
MNAVSDGLFVSQPFTKNSCLNQYIVDFSVNMT